MTERHADLAELTPLGVWSPAVGSLVDELSIEAPRRVRIPEAASTPSAAARPPALLDAPTIALARGRFVGDPVARREFRRTDTIVVRASTRGESAVTAYFPSNVTIANNTIFNVHGYGIIDDCWNIPRGSHL